MSLDVDRLMDRRRLKRRLILWRVLAVVAVLAAITVFTRGMAVSALGDRIARVTVTDIIFDNPDLVDTIKALADDDAVKAVVVHVDSPGGTTVGAETLYEAIRTVAEVKPVVATMGTVAASGGYIAAIAADHIVARGNTITGSIGVVFQAPEFSGFLKTVGVSVEEIKSSPLKAEPSGIAPMPPEAREAVRSMVLDSYDWFIALVAERRGLTLEEARRLGDGRVYSGRQAVAVDLIDELGGEAEAIAWLSDAHDVDPNLPVRDAENPSKDEIGAVFGSSINRIVKNIKGMAGIPVDGLVSVWHPARQMGRQAE